jgi:hypothetical protein
VTGRLLHHGNPYLTNAVGRMMSNILPSELDCAFCRAFKTNDQLEQCALACAIGANDGENLTIVDLCGHSVNSGETTVVLYNAIKLK